MFYVALRQADQGLQHPVYVGPFHDEESAYEYASEENLRLSMRGIPSWVASYAVTA